MGYYFGLVLFFLCFDTILHKHSKVGLKLFSFSFETKTDSSKSYSVLIHINLCKKKGNLASVIGHTSENDKESLILEKI